MKTIWIAAKFCPTNQITFFVYRRSCDGNRFYNVFAASLFDRQPHLGLARRGPQQLDGQHLRPEQSPDGRAKNTDFGGRRIAYEFAGNREN